MRFRSLAILILATFLTNMADATQVELSPLQPTPGEVFRVTAEGVGPGAEVRVEFGNREFTLWQRPDGIWEGLAAVDRDRASGATTLRLLVDQEGKARSVAEVAVTVAPREYPEQHLQVREGMVNLAEEDQQRAARENRLIRKVLGRRTGERLWQTPFSMPLNGPVTSTFGVRRVYNGTPKGYHSGLDIAAPRGTPVLAAGTGTVALVGDYFYTGMTVFVDHGLGLYTAYFHLDSVTVEEGDTVTLGGELGLVGSTGRSTGPHLHWGVYLSGRKADPLSLLQAYSAAGGGESP